MHVYIHTLHNTCPCLNRQLFWQLIEEKDKKVKIKKATPKKEEDSLYRRAREDHKKRKKEDHQKRKKESSLKGTGKFTKKEKKFGDDL